MQRSAAPLVKPHNFMHPDDYLVLEDESGRVKLGGDVILPSVYVTGLFNEQIEYRIFAATFCSSLKLP